MTDTWSSKPISETSARRLAEKTQLPLSVCRLLVSLDITNSADADAFFRPTLKQLHHPFLLKDMKKAAERISLALDRGERILGFGDYDCDGVTTTALFQAGFRLLGVEIDVFAPNRFTDGYGLNPERITTFSRDYDLIISGDTGIRAFEAARIVKEQGRADLIITDHHEPLEGPSYSYYEKLRDLLSDEERIQFELLPDRHKALVLQRAGLLPKDAVIEQADSRLMALPDAYAVIDPHRLGDTYPNKALAGVGVVFKLFQALFLLRKQDMKPLFYLLDLVATGTIADLAQQIDRRTGKLDFENHAMCKYGIAVMNQKPKPWVKAISLTTFIKKLPEADAKMLKEAEAAAKEANDEALLSRAASLRASLEQTALQETPFFSAEHKIDASAIGFRIGPTLNAPGRLEDPQLAVSLLLEPSEEAALAQARALKVINARRQEQTKSAKEDMIAELAAGSSDRHDYGIVVQSEAFHIGIAGLVASQLQQHYHRPAIALAPASKAGKPVLKGSARSIPGVHVLRCLDYVKDLIGPYEYGGHEQAAGLSIAPERFEAFQRAFREACMQVSPETFLPHVFYDAQIDLPEVNEALLDALALFEPCGEGMFSSSSKKPLFRTNGLSISSCQSIMEGKGAIFTFTDGQTERRGVTFQKGAAFLPLYEAQSAPFVVDVLFSPSLNVWKGKRSVQLLIEEMSFYSSPPS